MRIALVIASLLYIRAPLAFFVLYSLSCLLDVADGYAARYFDQCKRRQTFVPSLLPRRCSPLR